MSKVQIYKASIPLAKSLIEGKSFYIPIEPNSVGVLNTINFSSFTKLNRLVAEKAISLYNRMISNDRLCVISITIFSPLSEVQVDALNAQRVAIGYTVGAAIGGAVGKIPLPLGLNFAAGSAAGMGARKLTLSNLPQRHIDDILISLEAYVNGGIGPQKSYQSHTISRNQYK